MSLARHPKRLFLAVSVAVLAWTGAAAAADFTIDNVSFPERDKKPAVAIKTIVVKGSNLSREDFARIYDPATPKEEALALARKLEVASVSAPEIVFTKTGKDAGTITFRGYELTNFNQGKLAKFVLGGVAGSFKADDGDVSLKAGQLTIEDADFSKVLEAVAKDEIPTSSPRIGKMDFRDFEARFPEKGNSGPLYHVVKVGSVTGAATYSGDLPTKALGEVKGVVFIPAANSEAAGAMTQFGYSQVDIGLRGEGAYNPATRAYDLTDFTINGVNAGALTLKGLFGNIGPEAFNGEQFARLGALLAGDVSTVSLRYADTGLFDKALVFYAKTAGKDPQAVRQEWAGMIAGILPMMTGGDPGAMKVASAVSEFVKAPKSLMISITGKGGPVKFSQLQSVQDPAALLKMVEIEAVANR